MTLPTILNDDMEKYKQEINPTESFISCKFIKSDNTKDRVARGSIYDIYKQWATDNGYNITIKKAEFYKSIDNKYGEAKKIAGNFYYTGLKHIETEEDDEDEHNLLDG